MINVKPKNYNKVPEKILIEAKDFKKDNMVVGSFVKVTKVDILNGKYDLGIKLHKGKMTYEPYILPNKSLGKYSKINREGYKKVMYNLPKEDRIIYSEAPNFNGNGTHTTSRIIKARPFEIINPKEFVLKLELLEEENNSYLFKIYVEEILNSEDNELENKLLYNINLLRESIGTEDIISVDAKLSEYTETLMVDWDILPVGNSKETYNEIVKKYKFKNNEDKQKLKDRYDTLLSLKPKQFIKGTNGFRRYFGAKFDENLVVFENLEYGNAIYVMYDNWENLSKLNRTQLMSLNNELCERVEHRKTWRTVLKMIIENRRNK
jgi:hypothetical protein